MKRETHELAWRIKLVVGLAVLGAVVGGATYLHFFIFERQAAELQQYGVAAWRLVTLDEPSAIEHFRQRFFVSAGIGAAVLAGPLLLFLLKPRGGYRP